MSNYDQTLQDRLSLAAQAKKNMLENFKKSLNVDDPAKIERRRQREAELAKQALIEAEAAAAAKAAMEEQAARDAAEQAERQTALLAEQKAARDARYAARKAAKKERRRGY